MRSHTKLLAVTLTAALVAGACGDDDDEEAASTTAAPATTEAPAADGGTDAGGGTGSGGGTTGGATCEEGLSIGFFGALTGEAANLGINIKQGAELAVEQFNEANPDCQVELQEFDSQGSPDQAPQLAQQAVGDESLVGIIGPAFSGESRAANPIFDEAGLPLITPSATGVDLSEQGWEVFHRALGNDGTQGPAAGAYITGTLGAQTVAIVDDASEYGKGLAEQVAERVEADGAEIALTDTIDPTAQDFASTVNAVRQAAPDVIFYGGYYAEAGRFARQLRDAGVEATFVAGDGVKDPGFVEAAGPQAAEGAVMTCPCAPAAGEFATEYEEAFGQAAGTYSAEAYDAANIFLQAIAEGNSTREAILEYLKTVEYQGETKLFSFDEKGEVSEVTIYAYTVEGGEVTGGEPIEL